MHLPQGLCTYCFPTAQKALPPDILRAGSLSPVGCGLKCCLLREAFPDYSHSLQPLPCLIFLHSTCHCTIYTLVSCCLRKKSHTFSGLKQHILIISEFCWSEVGRFCFSALGPTRLKSRNQLPGAPTWSLWVRISIQAHSGC